MALVDQYGKDIKNSRPILEELGVAGVRDRYSSYPSQGLTPERLAAIFREADQGDIRRQAELFEEMEEKDSHLASVLGTRKLAVAGLEWEVAAASEDKEDEKIAAFVKEAIGWIENWDDALIDLLDAVSRGFSAAEIMWELAENRVWPKELKWRHQKKFTFVDRDVRAGISEEPRLLTDEQPSFGEELPPNKFIIHRYRGRSGITPRSGILRPCAWMYLFKNYTVKDWVIFNERFAMPMRVGKYSPGASEDERKVLRNAVFNLGADAAAVISDSTIIELLAEQSKRGSADLYEKLATFCERAMSKAVLGHTGSADSTPGKLGSEDEARDVRQDLLEADAKALAKTLTMQLVYPLVGFNFGFDRALPRFQFRHEAGVDRKALAETYASLVKDMGFDGIPKSHIYERFGIPLPEGGEETVKPAPAPLAFKQATRRMAMSSLAHDDEWVEKYMERIAPSLKGARVDALERVEAYLRSLSAPPAFEEFEASVQGILGESFAKIDRAAISDAVTEMYLWHKLTDLIAPGVDVAFGGADVRAVEFLTKLDDFYLSKFVRNADAKNAVTAFLKERYIEGGEGLFGRGGTAAVQELKDLLGQKLIDLSEGQARRIAETAVQRTRNWAHISQLSDAGIFEAEVYEPTQDCEFCRAMHGRVIRVETAYAKMREHAAMGPEEYEAELKANAPTLENIESFVDRGLLPPYHPHCRGRLIKRLSQ